MPDILTPAQVAECRERAERATDGPWEAKCSWHDYPYIVNSKGPLGCGTDFGKMPDASFIAHARTDIPALCATVEALREENERLREALLQIVGLPDAHARSLEIAVDALAALEARDE